MRAPTIYWPSQIKAWDVQESRKHPDTGEEYWQPARPESGLRTRFIDRAWIAWHVFTGDLDALDWRDKDAARRLIISTGTRQAEMTTETFEIELDDGSKTFDVEVSFAVEPTEFEGQYLFYAGGYSAEEWRSVDGLEEEILQGQYVGQASGESVGDFILRYADENCEGKPPVSRYPAQRA